MQISSTGHSLIYELDNFSLVNRLLSFHGTGHVFLFMNRKILHSGRNVNIIMLQKEIKTRYPKTPDLDLMNGTHIVRSLHVKKENRSCSNSACKNYTTDLSGDSEESVKPAWLVFDKQVRLVITHRLVIGKTFFFFFFRYANFKMLTNNYTFFIKINKLL